MNKQKCFLFFAKLPHSNFLLYEGEVYNINECIRKIGGSNFDCPYCEAPTHLPKATETLQLSGLSTSLNATLVHGYIALKNTLLRDGLEQPFNP